MTVSIVRRDRWAYLLAPQLTGRAQKAFAAMGEVEASDYDVLKTAILKRYNINEETYRRQLRASAKQSGESYRELATRVMDLMCKWTTERRTREEVLEQLAVEQLLESMPEDVRIWIRERKPKTCAEAGELADDYVHAGQVEWNDGDDVEGRGATTGTAKEVFFLRAAGTSSFRVPARSDRLGGPSMRSIPIDPGSRDATNAESWDTYRRGALRELSTRRSDLGGGGQSVGTEPSTGSQWRTSCLIRGAQGRWCMRSWSPGRSRRLME